ncbi:CLAVATA3/ESR (CLE)-related protein 1-like [Pyrus ussuriensis x Pyrus communis]|uniref:CLAVATA3/ESR (CLE)-related protein 1-like n=1 Tax=Pyrus ussuriensis x Pyrus communis TaxID=2448454 RepID=A0A5N5H2A1_9ROSA|nr:CLAVATA3/ESR (CLE)-related protein 1-like [Pyrus ussuriensis x Pyrus communis]
MKVWLCRFLALLSNLSNEARVPCTLSNKGSQTTIESAKKVMKASIERQVGRYFDPKQRSPGGPIHDITSSWP